MWDCSHYGPKMIYAYNQLLVPATPEVMRVRSKIEGEALVYECECACVCA